MPSANDSQRLPGSPSNSQANVSLYDPFYRYVVRPWRLRKHSPRFPQRRRRLQEALESPRLEELVSRRLNALAVHAATNIPFWRRRFAAAGVKPHNAGSLDDLRDLPVLDKSEVREKLAELASPEDTDLLADMTGGSTAAPMRFFRDRQCLAERLAHEWLVMSWYGRQPHHRWAHIWGSQRDLGEAATFQSRLRARLLERSLILPANALSPPTIDAYLESVRRFKPRFVHGYSQGVFLVALRALETGWTPPRLMAVTVTAEPISAEQKQIVSRAFACPVYSIYGTREFSLIAAERPEEEGLHINPLNVLVEVLTPEGAPAPPGAPGQVVVTDLLNWGMPFIRYRIGDIAAAMPPGRLGLPRLEFVGGRETDFIVASDGRFVSGASLTLVSAPGVAQLQYIQLAEDVVEVRYIRASGFTDGGLAELSRRVADVLGPGIELRLREVSEIPLLPSGKLQYVYSEVARTWLALSPAACSQPVPATVQ